MSTKSVRTAIIGAIASLAIVACDDNPVSSDREVTVGLAVNPTFAVVDAADTTRVDAFARNKYGDKTRPAVTASACDNKIAVVQDPERVTIEPPDRWIVVGQTLGETCLNFSGSGFADSTVVQVVPSAIETTLASPLGSGSSAQASLTFLDKAAAPVMGMGPSDVVFSVANPSVADVDETGAVIGKSPGTTDLVVTLAPNWNTVRVSSVEFTVEPGPFGGTITPASANWGDTITVSAAAGTFDDDTDLTFDGLLPYVVSFDESSEFVVVGPAGMGGPPSEVLILNAGESQLAFVDTIDVPNPNPADANEPNNAGGGGGGTLPDLNEVTPATLPFAQWISVGSTDLDDVFQITLAAQTTINFGMDWNYTDADFDILFYDGTGSLISDFGCASGDAPEACSVTFGAGTYYIDVNVWDDGGFAWSTVLLTMN